MYDQPFQITDKRSNNVFSFEKRKNPTIYIPSLVEGKIEDIEIGNQVVFEDFEEKGKLKSCVGLLHFVWTNHLESGKPIVIVDNHNHVFYFWHKARENGLIRDGATLVHIDQHKDTRRPERWISENDAHDLKKVFEYTNSVLNVGNYIPSAVKDGIIGKVISVTSEKEMDNHSTEGVIGQSRLRDGLSIILNIDLDFWAPEMNYIPNDKKTEFTRRCMEKADLITIATSPFFIDQGLAIEVLRKLVGRCP